MRESDLQLCFHKKENIARESERRHRESGARSEGYISESKEAQDQDQTDKVHVMSKNMK